MDKGCVSSLNFAYVFKYCKQVVIYANRGPVYLIYHGKLNSKKPMKPF